PRTAIACAAGALLATGKGSSRIDIGDLPADARSRIRGQLWASQTQTPPFLKLTVPHRRPANTIAGSATRGSRTTKWQPTQVFGAIELRRPRCIRSGSPTGQESACIGSGGISALDSVWLCVSVEKDSCHSGCVRIECVL